ncbi:hypothetical protein GGI42DRAFT_295669 [Trichoderma sp. SZMC 28013]
MIRSHDGGSHCLGLQCLCCVVFWMHFIGRIMLPVRAAGNKGAYRYQLALSNTANLTGFLGRCLNATLLLAIASISRPGGHWERHGWGWLSGMIAYPEQTTIRKAWLALGIKNAVKCERPPLIRISLKPREMQLAATDADAIRHVGQIPDGRFAMHNDGVAMILRCMV